MVDAEISITEAAESGSYANVDTKSLTGVGGKTVHRQVACLGDPVTFGNVANVTSAGALKVDGSAVTQPVSDAGGSITVDGTVTANLAAGTNNIGDVDVLSLPSVPTGTNTIGKVQVRNNADSANIDPLSESTFTTRINTLGQKTMAASTPVVLPSDQAVQVSSASPLQISDVDAKNDDVIFNVASDKVTVIGGFADETSPDSVNEGDAGAIRMTLLRALHTNLRDSSGSEIGTAGAPIRVDTTGATTQPVSLAASIPSGTNNIGDVDVLTLPATPTGDNTIGRIKITDGTEVANVDTSNRLEVAVANTPSVTVSGSVDTELPTVAALADGTSNPTTTSVGSMPHLLNSGGTWTRQKSIFASLDQTGAGIAASGIVAQLDDTTPSTVTENQFAPVRMNPDRALHVNLRSGSSEVGTSGAPIRIDPTGTTTQPVSISATITVQDNSSKVDDSAFTPATDRVVMVGAEYDDTTPDIVDEGDAGALRMTNARSLHTTIRDSTGDSAMDDTNNALRVNVVAGGAGDGSILDGVSSSIKATVFDYTNSNPLAVRLTDTSGDYVGAGAGTQYTEDAASAADPVGTQIISRRRDALSGTEVSADGDVIAVNSTSKGELYVKHVDAIPVTDNAGSLTVDGTISANLNAGTNNIGDVDVLTVPAPLSTSGGGTEASALRVTIANDSTGLVSVDDNGGSLTVDGTITANAGSGTFTTQDTASKVDDAAFTAATDRVIPVGFVFDDTSPDTVNEGDVGYARMTDTRSVHTTLRDSTGDSAMDDTNNAVRVNIVAGGAGDGAINDGVSSSIKATVFDYTNSNPLSVRLTDTNGDYVSAGGGTQYTEDVASATDPIGTQLIARRRDTLSSETSANGDNVAVNSTDKGELYVKHVDAIPVTDNSGSLTVDGTITANAGTGNFNIIGTKTHDSTTPGTNNIGTLPAICHATNPTYTDTNQVSLSVNQSGSLRTTMGNPATNRTASAALGSANAAVTINSQGTGTIIWEIDTGTLVGTVVFEATLDDSNWFAVNSMRIDGTIISSTTSFSDRGEFTTSGYSQARLRVSAYTSGTSNARMEAGTTSDIVRIGQALPVGDNNIGNVDVLTVPAPLSTSGGGTEASSLRVTIANDSTGLVSVDDNGSTLSVDDGAGSLTVDNGGTFAIQDSEKVADNAAFTDGTTKILPAGFIFDETAGTALTENDAAAARIDSKRAIVFTLEDETTRGRRATVTASNALKVDNSAVTQPVSGTISANLNAGTNTNEVVGDVAHDAAAAGNPVLIAASSETMADSAPANRVSADADASRLSVTDGALYVIPTAPQMWSYHTNSLTVTDASVHSAPGAGLSIYVTDIVFSIGAATASSIFFEEGATTVLGSWYLEAVNGRGMSVHFGTPKKITANTALTVTTTGATTGSIDVTGFIAPG